YVDGGLVGTLAAGSTPATADANPVQVGRNSASSSQYYAGDIDEIRVAGRAFSDAEIANDGAGRLPYTDSGLIANSVYSAILEAFDGTGSAGLTPSVTRYTLAETPTAFAVTAASSNT